jgi:hypothetical protein
LGVKGSLAHPRNKHPDPLQQGFCSDNIVKNLIEGKGLTIPFQPGNISLFASEIP